MAAHPLEPIPRKGLKLGTAPRSTPKRTTIAAAASNFSSGAVGGRTRQCAFGVALDGAVPRCPRAGFAFLPAWCFFFPCGDFEARDFLVARGAFPPGLVAPVAPVALVAAPAGGVVAARATGSNSAKKSPAHAMTTTQRASAGHCERNARLPGLMPERWSTPRAEARLRGIGAQLVRRRRLLGGRYDV